MRKIQADRAIKDVGRRLAEVRNERGFTQEQLAERLGIQSNNLQRIELGMQNLTIRTLVRFANELAVPLSALFVAPESRIVRPGRPARKR